MRIPGVRYVQGRNDYDDRDDRKFGIAVHNTSNDASDEGEASYAQRRTDGVSAHLYADHDTVTQSLSLLDRAGHAGSNTGNENAIALEITGANGWTRQQWLDRVCWDKVGAALAWAIRNVPGMAGFQVRRASVAEMKTNPRVRAMYGHNDMRLAWGGTTHTDPGPNFPWDRLARAVTAALGGTAEGEDDQMSWDEIIGVQWAPAGFGADRARTALGWTWFQATTAAQTAARIEALLTESKQRELDTLAAVAAIRAADGNVDVAAVKAHIDQRAAELREVVDRLQAENAELRHRLAAAARAEADTLAGGG